MNRTDLKHLIEGLGFSPNKRLGQNFLVNDDAVSRIIKSVGVTADDLVLEIGPGLGALSEHLLSAAKTTLVEIDSGIAGYLKEKFMGDPRVEIIHSDFLKTGLKTCFTKVVSNLPYYCASEIIFKVIADFPSADMFIMLQKEMADRILATSGTRSYGSLSVAVQFYFDVEKLVKVSHDSFYPVPDVDSLFIRLKRKKSLPLDDHQIEMFHLLVRSAFWGRRKTLSRALTDSPHLDFGKKYVDDIIEKAGISPKLRGEELTVENFVTLAKNFKRENIK